MLTMVTVWMLATQGVPLASEAERVLAPLEISRDGGTVTFRGTASDALKVCVAPKVGQFGRTRCFTVGQIRRGEVGVK